MGCGRPAWDERSCCVRRLARGWERTESRESGEELTTLMTLVTLMTVVGTGSREPARTAHVKRTKDEHELLADS